MMMRRGRGGDESEVPWGSKYRTLKDGEEKGEMKIGREVAQKMKREGENKVFKLLVAKSEAAHLQRRKKRGSDTVGEAGREIEMEVLEERKRGSLGDLQ